jgi:hypothetical protein
MQKEPAWSRHAGEELIRVFALAMKFGITVTTSETRFMRFRHFPPMSKACSDLQAERSRLRESAGSALASQVAGLAMWTQSDF